MDKYIDRFPDQLLDALEIGERIPELVWSDEIQNVIIAGMGGSGIGGLFVKEITQDQIRVPVLLIRDYTLPAFANDHSLVICSSYSGNTEETISVLLEAIKRKCNIVCVTTGGEMQKTAIHHQITTITIPGDMPPRSCLGFSMIAQLYILFRSGLINGTFKVDVLSSVEMLKSKKEAIKNDAELMSSRLKNKIPIVYTSSEMEAVGIRWKQQINENSKMPCFSNNIPEMNHNELVGFYDQHDEIAVLLLRNLTDHPRIQKRFELVKELIAGKTGPLIELFSEGESYMEKMFYFIHFGDWLSFYLAEQNQVDAVRIEMLDELKRRL